MRSIKSKQVMCASVLALSMLALPREIDASEEPNMELLITDKLLTELLVAVSPIEHTVKGEALGLTGAGKIHITLSNPQARISSGAVKVKMGFRVRDESGLLDLNGVATPDLRIVAMPDKKQIEARFVRFLVTLPGGVGVALDGYLEPILLPGVWSNELMFGDKQVAAEAVAKEVVLEPGRVRLRGVVVFKPKR